MKTNFNKFLASKGFRVALGVAGVVAAASSAKAVDATALPTFADTVTSVSASTGTYLLPGMSAIAGVGGVVWLFHRVTGKFTKRKA